MRYGNEVQRCGTRVNGRRGRVRHYLFLGGLIRRLRQGNTSWYSTFLYRDRSIRLGTRPSIIALHIKFLTNANATYRTASCLLPPASCLLPSASCLLLPAFLDLRCLGVTEVSKPLWSIEGIGKLLD